MGQGTAHWGRRIAYPNESLPTPMRRPGAGRPASSSAGAPPPPCYAHKGPELDNTHRTHRLDSALVCAGVLCNSGRCVRGRGWVFRTICLVGAVLSGLGLLSWETCKRSGVFKGKPSLPKRYNTCKVWHRCESESDLTTRPRTRMRLTALGRGDRHWGRKPPIGVGKLPTPMGRCLPR